MSDTSLCGVKYSIDTRWNKVLNCGVWCLNKRTYIILIPRRTGDHFDNDFEVLFFFTGPRLLWNEKKWNELHGCKTSG